MNLVLQIFIHIDFSLSKIILLYLVSENFKIIILIHLFNSIHFVIKCKILPPIIDNVIKTQIITVNALVDVCSKN